MDKQKSRLYIGIAIITFGVLALLVNTNILRGLDDLVGGALLLLVALFFFMIYNRDKTKWWPLLPGTVLAVLGAGVILDVFIPLASDLMGAAFMYSIFAVFAIVFSRDKDNWWAAIPAGVTFTLGTIVLVESFDLLSSDMNGVIFFLGIGLTFLYLFSLRQDIKNLDWAIWPAGVLLGLSFFVYLNQVRWMDEEFVFPLLIILVGVIIIVYGSRRKK
jgi:hypothetical protein